MSRDLIVKCEIYKCEYQVKTSDTLLTYLNEGKYISMCTYIYKLSFSLYIVL